MVAPVNTDLVRDLSDGRKSDLPPDPIRKWCRLTTQQEKCLRYPRRCHPKIVGTSVENNTVGVPIEGGGTDGGIVTTNPFAPGFKTLAGVPCAL